MTKKAELTKEFGFLKVNGKYYEFNDKAIGRTSYLEVSTKEVKARLNLINEIVIKLKDGLDKDAVLRESLSKLPKDYLHTIHNALYNSKRKSKPKTREHHCVDMKVGKMVIPIVD